jgi:TPR repeat protein
MKPPMAFRATNKKRLAGNLREAQAGEQSEIAGYYAEADGVVENWEAAARWYQQSAVQGCVKGELGLGAANEFGIGVPQNRPNAS